MKALSLWQPWASAIAQGLKTCETRSWSTDYRGPLIICATKRGLSGAERAKMEENRWWRRVLELLKVSAIEDLPTGVALCQATLADVLWTEKASPVNELDRFLGDWTPGRYAWKLTGVERFMPVPVRGAQSLFVPSAHEQHAIRLALRDA